MTVCPECGMPVDKATTYHPYAACLMFKACHNSEVVQANLDSVVFHGMQIGNERLLKAETLLRIVASTRTATPSLQSEARNYFKRSNT